MSSPFSSMIVHQLLKVIFSATTHLQMRPLGSAILWIRVEYRQR
jgi:hypothetical protein